MWEKTSYEIEKIQSNVITAEEEFNSLENRLGPVYSCNFILNEPLVLSGILCINLINTFNSICINNKYSKLFLCYKICFKYYIYIFK